MAGLPPDPSRGLENHRIRGPGNRTYFLFHCLECQPHATSYKCILETGEGRPRCECKVYTKREIDRYMLREINVLHRVQCQNVLGMQDFLESEDFLFVITPFFSGGSLFDKLEQRGRRFSEHETRRILMQVARGLAHLHGEGICHNDLGLETILCSGEEENFQVAISGFGLATFRGENEGMREVLQQYYYAAPEIVRHEEQYIEASDIWSFGVVAYCLLTEHFPFAGEGIDLGRLIVQGQYDTALFDRYQVSDAARNFIARILRVNPDERPTASDLVYDDPWLNDIDDN